MIYSTVFPLIISIPKISTLISVVCVWINIQKSIYYQIWWLIFNKHQRIPNISRIIKYSINKITHYDHKYSTRNFDKSISNIDSFMHSVSFIKYQNINQEKCKFWIWNEKYIFLMKAINFLQFNGTFFIFIFIAAAAAAKKDICRLGLFFYFVSISCWFECPNWLYFDLLVSIWLSIYEHIILYINPISLLILLFYKWTIF